MYGVGTITPDAKKSRLGFGRAARRAGERCPPAATHKRFEPAPHHQLFIREMKTFLKSEDEVLLLFAPHWVRQEHVCIGSAAFLVSRRQSYPQHSGSHAQR